MKSANRGQLTSLHSARLTSNSLHFILKPLLLPIVYINPSPPPPFSFLLQPPSLSSSHHFTFRAQHSRLPPFVSAAFLLYSLAH